MIADIVRVGLIDCCLSKGLDKRVIFLSLLIAQYKGRRDDNQD